MTNDEATLHKLRTRPSLAHIPMLLVSTPNGPQGMPVQQWAEKYGAWQIKRCLSCGASVPVRLKDGHIPEGAMPCGH